MIMMMTTTTTTIIINIIIIIIITGIINGTPYFCVLCATEVGSDAAGIHRVAGSSDCGDLRTDSGGHDRRKCARLHRCCHRASTPNAVESADRVARRLRPSSRRSRHAAGCRLRSNGALVVRSLLDFHI